MRNNTSQNPDPSGPGQVPPALASRRRWIPVTAVVGGVLVAGVAVGGTALATTSDSGTGLVTDGASTSSPLNTDGTTTPDSTDAPAAPQDGTAPAAPGDGPLGGGPRVGGPRAGGGPGAGGPGAGLAHGGPAGALAEDGTRVVGVITAVSASSITVQGDDGTQTTFALTDNTRYRTSEPAGPGFDRTPPKPGQALGQKSSDGPDGGSSTRAPAVPEQGSASDLTAGQRVEVIATDNSDSENSATAIGVVTAHVDGTVLSVDGDSAVVVARDGLRTTLDLSGTDDTVSAGDQVRATGSANSDGSALVVSSVQVAGS